MVKPALIQLFFVAIAYSLAFVLPNALISSPQEAQDITAWILPILLIVVFVPIRQFGLMQLCGISIKRDHAPSSKGAWFLFLGALLVPLANIVHAILSGSSGFAAPALFIVLACGAIIEELIFRGYIMGILLEQGWMPLNTVLVSASIFAFLHLFNGNNASVLATVLQVIASFSLGTVFGSLRLACKTIYPAMIVHVLINITSAHALLYEGTVIWASWAIAMIMGLCSILWWFRNNSHIHLAG